MKRPRQQIIDDAGERQMRSIFEPLGWAVRKLDRDVGIDFSIEVFEDFKSTGVIFKVQLKSSTLTKYSKSKNFITQSLKISNARYLCNELRLPVVLIHADVKNERTYWCAPQLMIDQLERQTDGTNRKHLSVRILTSNELPATITRLVETVTQAEQVLAYRLIISTPTPTYVRLIDRHVNPDDLTREFQDKADFIKLVQAHRLSQAGRHAEAIERAQKVFDGCDVSILTKFNAVLTIEAARLMAVAVNQEPQHNYHLIRLETGRQLKELTRKGPRILKFHAIVVWETAKLYRLTQRYHGLLLNWVAQRHKGNVTWKARLLFEKTSCYRQIVGKYNQCIRLANYSARLKGAADISRLLMRIVDAMAHFIGNLEYEKYGELADAFSSSALQICKLARAIAVEHRDDEGLFTVATKALMTKRAPTGESVDFATATIDEIHDEETKQKTREFVDRVIRSYRGEKLESPIRTTYRQVYENMATALGVNLNDPADPISGVVQIGLADLDPSRILINCEHIFITYGAHGLVAELLDMPTAGHKIIHCDLHEYAMHGLALDGTYRRFKKKFCDNCTDCLSRPTSWHYSEEWQQEENQKHMEFVKEFERRVGMR